MELLKKWDCEDMIPAYQKFCRICCVGKITDLCELFYHIFSPFCLQSLCVIFWRVQSDGGCTIIVSACPIKATNAYSGLSFLSYSPNRHKPMITDGDNMFKCVTSPAEVSDNTYATLCDLFKNWCVSLKKKKWTILKTGMI